MCLTNGLDHAPLQLSLSTLPHSPPDLLFLPGRQTYVFDPNGKCVMSFNSQLDAEKHVDEALAALASIKKNVSA